MVRTNTKFLFILVLAFGFLSHAEAAFDHSHQKWNAVLQKAVVVRGHASWVNYKSIKEKPQELTEYLASLEAVTKDEFSHFSNDEKLAFLINSYNALTVKLIVEHYPTTSIKNTGVRTLSNLSASPWKNVFFKLLGGDRYLDYIEHEILRKSFNEPRIHFALVCASISCPALQTEAYTASHLDHQFEKAAENFLTDQERNRYIPGGSRLELSSIFKWYGDDFAKKYGSYLAFIGPRITKNPEFQKAISDGKATVSFLDYNWNLNEEK